MTSAVSEGDFNEFLHTICVCSVCHVINRTRVLLFTTVASGWKKPLVGGDVYETIVDCENTTILNIISLAF
jgi:hypothetical protein